MNRITEKNLLNLVEHLNRITDSPLESYAKDSKGKMKSNIGNYHLDWAYGGVCLRRMHNESGGVSTPISSGYVSKRELYYLIHAYLNGYCEGKGI
jgi:hypothetical protein